MLQSLSIQGLAIIDSLAIDFSPGFNVITGETGAGKSILIRALNLLMGGKASQDAIRQGAQAATIAGEFVVPRSHRATLTLTNLGIPFEEIGGTVVILIRRQVTMKGRSQGWVNDVAVTTHSLREVGATLLDIFAQHENQRMLDASEHFAYVDSFLKDHSLKLLVRKANEACFETLHEIQKLLATFQQNEKNRDYLSFRIEELKNFSPTREDHDSIELLCQSTEQNVRAKEILTKALSDLNGGGEGIAAHFKETARTLARWESPKTARGGDSTREGVGEVSALREKALELAALSDDLNYEIEKLLGQFDVDESELQSAQERLYSYQDLFRKLSVQNIDGLLQETERLQEELSFLDSAAEKLDELLGTLIRSAHELKAAAARLSEGRKLAAKQIKKKIENELTDLAMKGASIEVELTPYQRALQTPDLSRLGAQFSKKWTEVADILSGVGENGAEKVQFLLSSNPGEPSLPLARIASGGEVSRIMLAFKRALAVDAETCVLVFDEIDTGISGRVADVVGQKMQELAAAFQVICISHLPQVAVYADTHFLVQKQKKGPRTETSLVRMSRDQSAKEIARLLSGKDLSATSLANAKSLIQDAEHRKKKIRSGRTLDGQVKGL